MASLIQRLSHSFMATLFYIWTVIQALISIRSSAPFPFRETSAVVPCAIEIDLEKGTTVKRERCAYPMPAPPLASSTQGTSRQVVQKAADMHSHRQQEDKLTSFLGFSSGSASGPFRPEFISIDLSASIVPASESPDPPKKTTGEGTNHDFDLNLAGNLTMDPFLDVKPVSPLATYPFNNGYTTEDAEPSLFTLPLCTSTPPRSRRGGKGHRRGAFAIITKPEHINASKFPIEFDSLSSPTDTESVIETPSVRRQRTASPRQSVDFGIFDSPPSVWPTPKRPALSIVVRSSTPKSSSSPEPILKPTTPLRIVKRNEVRSSTTSAVSRAVISAVRDAFVETREEDENDPAADPRDLLSRTSVWTCHTLPVGCSKSDISVYEDEDAEDKDAQELGAQEPATPPPPYALSNFNATDTVTDGLKADTVKAFWDIKRCSISSNGSTELGYLVAMPGSVPASVDSCLDDILASFENLMAVMPEFHPSLAKAQTAKLLSVANQEQTGSSC
ncbi:hypothetical protein E4T56_gene18934 [Termitomyces sp. T112]|nr:hypothetical protein C0989_012231 [Termitomyces sp. Mn162]KAG5726382.1 hypothetical protein E4T56_gene18934 [Termitomyces sp. T112]KAH0585561.1 hypothetical protein H2248_008791 [Termitomyces sp. 'cryptogamus']KNZ73369.1 hypothetical protein J132_07667 [Termitomyces sp. J132]